MFGENVKINIGISVVLSFIVFFKYTGGLTMLNLLNGSSPTNCKSKCDWLKKRIIVFSQ